MAQRNSKGKSEESLHSNSFPQKTYKNRNELGAYTANPQKYVPSRVLYYDNKFVVINDMYPKASVHTLLLPRSKAHNLQHPFDAFEDADFLAEVRTEADKLRRHVAGELRRKFGKYSAQDAEREAILNGDGELIARVDGKIDLPSGRDWSEDVKIGIHAGPSMNHLHIHVISRDMFSERLKHRKHYNSFNTPFLVDLADFPLPINDPRRHHKGAFLSQDLVCWRCGQNFGNRFSKLKNHLVEEFERWKRE